MQKIGIKITIVNISAGTYFGTTLPTGAYDIGEFAWISSPFATGNNAIYCSYTDTANCGSNWTRAKNPAVDKLLKLAASATSPTVEASYYNQADKLLWDNMVTLPLYQKPGMTVWSNSVTNVLPNASSSGATWNANTWGVK
jgi:peptide/nickel transport system substrate-binding protein